MTTAPPDLPAREPGQSPGTTAVATTHGYVHPAVSSTATRHLNAGAYLDERFCRLSLDEVYHQPRRAVAPSFGFDLAVVLGHCLRADRINLIRDVAIIVLLFLAACVGAPGLLFGLGVAAGGYSLVATWRVINEVLRWQLTEEVSISRLVGNALGAVLGSLVSVLVLLTAVPVAGALAVSAGADAGDISAVLTLFGAGVTCTLAAVFGPPVMAEIVKWRYAAENGPGGRPTPVPETARMNDLRHQQVGNTTIFSGYSPFIGSGVRLSTEGFALRMIGGSDDFKDPRPEGEREYQEAPFAAVDLIGHVRRSVGELTDAADPEQRLVGLTVTDRIFTAGRETRQLNFHTSAAEVEHFIREPADANRHYLACQVNSWDGELVTTVYVHYALQGRTLYFEVDTCALAPCRDEFRMVDDVSSIGVVPYLKVGWRALVDAPATVAAAPRSLFRAALRALSRRLSSSTATRGYDRGARLSVRELATPDIVRNDFQMQDVAKHKKIITRRVVAATLDFLVTRGVDVTEFRQNSRVLINSGIYAGGSIGDISDISNSFAPPGGPTSGKG
ncbi:hypothetical protein HCA58_12715 [Micromonospora sp. HNM0581]|uniref:hypothetical protein n=1 Tax=Micromonospora sp. HNM0581 TaxID=2716341 RepID=UPI00146E409B|nr:hypothetical protein [Micromonospora sp. HNM0581]NLU79224.1 hypothetical protein [Micromonospora sp. HNM0581]